MTSLNTAPRSLQPWTHSASYHGGSTRPIHRQQKHCTLTRGQFFHEVAPGAAPGSTSLMKTLRHLIMKLLHQSERALLQYWQVESLGSKNFASIGRKTLGRCSLRMSSPADIRSAADRFTDTASRHRSAQRFTDRIDTISQAPTYISPSISLERSPSAISTTCTMSDRRGVERCGEYGGGESWYGSRRTTLSPSRTTHPKMSNDVSNL